MNNFIYEDVVINPSYEMKSHITISPFSIGNQSDEGDSLNNLNIKNLGKTLFTGDRTLYITPKGRVAIEVCLRDLKLKPDDVVTILTTSGNFYVSSCVTKAIEKVCKWNRKIGPKTKVLFIIHEFGYAYQDLESLRQYNVPIIEDCAHSLFTTDSSCGQVGDYVIYSFPKAFNIQLGGGHFNKKEINCRSWQ